MKLLPGNPYYVGRWRSRGDARRQRDAPRRDAPQRRGVLGRVPADWRRGVRVRGARRDRRPRLANEAPVAGRARRRAGARDVRAVRLRTRSSGIGSGTSGRSRPGGSSGSRAWRGSRGTRWWRCTRGGDGGDRRLARVRRRRRHVPHANSTGRSRTWRSRRAGSTGSKSALGRWAKDALPEDARIGLNDTGAIAYFGDRRTFDIVGPHDAERGALLGRRRRIRASSTTSGSITTTPPRSRRTSSSTPSGSGLRRSSARSSKRPR